MPAQQPPANDGNPSAARRAPSYRGRSVDIVIDVRSKLEYWLGHLPGATCIPVNALAARLPARADIRADTKILIYCASGARSAAAATQLRALGYRHVTDAGAMSAAARDYAP